MTDLLSISASILSCGSMGVYLSRLIRGGSTPNPATWIIWLLIGSINLATYLFVVHGSYVQALPLVFVVVGIIGVTAFSAWRGKFSRIGSLDLLCFALALGVGAIWKITGDSRIANLTLQAVYVVSFIPTVAGLRTGKLHETALPWGLALGAYSLMIAGICLNWNHQSWIALAHPLLNGLLGNGMVFYYTLATKNSRSSAAFVPASFVNYRRPRPARARPRRTASSYKKAL